MWTTNLLPHRSNKGWHSLTGPLTCRSFAEVLPVKRYLSGEIWVLALNWGDRCQPLGLTHVEDVQRERRSMQASLLICLWRPNREAPLPDATAEEYHPLSFCFKDWIDKGFAQPWVLTSSVLIPMFCLSRSLALRASSSLVPKAKASIPKRKESSFILNRKQSYENYTMCSLNKLKKASHNILISFHQAHYYSPLWILFGIFYLDSPGPKLVSGQSWEKSGH